MFQAQQESQSTPFSSSESLLQSEKKIAGQPHLNSFIVEQQYRQTIQNKDQQDSVELEESSVLFQNFKKNKTIEDKIKSLIKLRRYIQNILEDSQLQDELLQKYNLVKLVRFVLRTRMNQQMRLQIYKIILCLTKVRIITPLFKLFFFNHIKLIQSIILQMLKDSKKFVNKLAIDIVGSQVSCYNSELAEFIVDQSLIKQIYKIILFKKIPAQETLCKIIEWILKELDQVDISLQKDSIEVIFDFLIAELPRYKKYVYVSIEQAYQNFADYLFNYNIKCTKRDIERIQKLLDIGQLHVEGFLIYFTWIIQKIGLTQIKINKALQYLKILVESEEYQAQSWRVIDIIRLLLRQKLTYWQTCLIKKIIDKVIKKGVIGLSTQSQQYQDALIRLFRDVVSGCHKNYSEFINKQHYYHIAKWTIFIHENQLLYDMALKFIKHQLIYALQTLNVGAAKSKLFRIKFIVRRAKLPKRKIIIKKTVIKENKISNKENILK